MRKKHGTLLYIALTFLVVSAGAKADQTVVIQAASAQLKPLVTTYSRAQSADWLDENRFVVGRWDGTISVFRQKSGGNEFGPVLVQPLSAPSRKAVELVAKVNEELFITSNDSSSLVVWRLTESGYKGDAVCYDSQYGAAVSAAMVTTPPLNPAGSCL